MIFEENIVLDDIDFKIHKNVETQICDIHTSKTFFTYYNSELEDNMHYFLLYETCFDSAFAHWIYESAVFLSYYQELKMKYPNLKLLIKNEPKRSYKKLILNAFNILDENIYWLDNIDKFGSEIVYEKIPMNNICITTPNIYLNTLDLPIKKYNLFKNAIINFKEKILNILNIKYPVEKCTENLFLPRSKNGENYKPNDRQVNYYNVHNLLKNKEYKEYDTKNTQNFKEQIEILINSKNIFLDGGSSFFVNSLFCKNSDIYIYNHDEQHYIYPFYSILCEINDNNRIHFM